MPHLPASAAGPASLRAHAPRASSRAYAARAWLTPRCASCVAAAVAGGHRAGVRLRQEQGPRPAGGVHYRQPPGEPAGGGRQVGGAGTHARGATPQLRRASRRSVAGQRSLHRCLQSRLCAAHPPSPGVRSPWSSQPLLTSPPLRRRCFEEGLYDAARIIYTRIPNYGRLASTLVRLHQFQAAVDAARKVRGAGPWGVVLPVEPASRRPAPEGTLLLTRRAARLNTIGLPTSHPRPRSLAGQLASHVEGGGVRVRGGGRVQARTALRPQHHYQRRRPHGGAPPSPCEGPRLKAATSARIGSAWLCPAGSCRPPAQL